MSTLYGKGYPTVPILHVFNYVQKVCGGSNPCSTNFLPNVQAREGGFGVKRFLNNVIKNCGIAEVGRH